MASGAEVLPYLNMTRYYNERQGFGVLVKCVESEVEPCFGPVFIGRRQFLLENIISSTGPTSSSPTLQGLLFTNGTIKTDFDALISSLRAVTVPQ